MLRKGEQRGEGEVRGVKCHIYTCMGGEEVGERGEVTEVDCTVCGDRTVLPQKSIGLSALWLCVWPLSLSFN